MAKVIEFLKKVKDIADEDSLRGYLLTILLVFIITKWIIFPLIGFALGGTNYPIVSVVSNSMEHRPNNNYLCGVPIFYEFSENFNNWWSVCGNYYTKLDITKEQFEGFSISNGFNVGDAIVLYNKKPEDIKIGDIIVYLRYDNKPIIHRVIKIEKIENNYFYTTKGDWNYASADYESRIQYSQIQGTAILKLPYFGYPKYLVSKLFGWI